MSILLFLQRSQKRNSMEMVTIEKILYQGLMEDRIYLEAVEMFLSLEILKQSEKIDEVYEDKLRRYEERTKFYNKIKEINKNG